jgi:hypothetical protein
MEILGQEAKPLSASVVRKDAAGTGVAGGVPKKPAVGNSPVCNRSLDH